MSEMISKNYNVLKANAIVCIGGLTMYMDHNELRNSWIDLRDKADSVTVVDDSGKINVALYFKTMPRHTELLESMLFADDIDAIAVAKARLKSAYSRGAADSYYRRGKIPHIRMEDGVHDKNISKDERAAYLKGYEENEDAMCHKEWR